MVYEHRLEFRRGLSEANLVALTAIERRASGRGVSDVDRGALVAFGMNATGDDLARVQALAATLKEET